jgi:hypothetical protein
MSEYPASEGAKTILTSHAASSGWQIEVGQMPDKPDKVIMIMDTGGRTPNPKWLVDFPSLQIMVRGPINSYTATFREAKAVKDLLLGITSQDILLDRWVSVTQNGDLGCIGRDANMRPLFSVNFALIIEPQIVANSNRLPL